MSLRQHLVELRKRLTIAAIAILVLSIAGWFLFDPVFRALQQPVAAMVKSHLASINFAGIGTPFDLRIQISITIGVILASPIWLWQILAFLVPGLTKREKRFTFGFVFTAIPLFLLGCAAGWFVFPHIVGVLNSFVPSGTTSFIEARDYYGFVLKLVLAVGIAFVLPVFLVLLDFIGIISGRSIIHSWRWAILVILLFCAIATPSADVGSMFLLAVPMVILYLGAALIAILHDRAVAKRTASLDSSLGDTAAA